MMKAKQRKVYFFEMNLDPNQDINKYLGFDLNSSYMTKNTGFNDNTILSVDQSLLDPPTRKSLMDPHIHDHGNFAKKNRGSSTSFKKDVTHSTPAYKIESNNNMQNSHAPQRQKPTKNNYEIIDEEREINPVKKDKTKMLTSEYQGDFDQD